jgi:predicted transposase YbfD/YdcC
MIRRDQLRFRFLYAVKLRPKTTISEHFSTIKDPRLDRTKLHQLIDIITITLCAVISGAETWSDIELFGNCKYDWFNSFLELPNGIPSHDTFSRVFARINPEQLQKCFSGWVKSINSLLEGELIAIDGKILRHSYDHNLEQDAIVMVSAWARNSGLVLAQRKVSKKSNEITAIPELLKVLELKGAIVTLDAMGCQREIVNQIVNQKADYLITLKKNQGGLYKRADSLFKEVLANGQLGYEYSSYSVDEDGHSRTENRCYQVLNNISEVIDLEQKFFRQY